MSETKLTPRVDWVRPLSSESGPRYIQIADLIANAVQSGELEVGDQIPPQRWLAQALGVDLTTVTRAYTEARNRGLISSFSGRGSFISGSRSQREDTPIDLSMNIPPQPSSGNMADLLKSAIDGVLSRRGIETVSGYQDASSTEALVHAGRAWLRPAVGSSGTQRDLLICAGTQSAIFSVLMSTTCKGDTILAEPLTYPGFLIAAQQLGLRVHCLAADEDGVLPDAVEQAHRETGATVMYLNPTLQNPTGVTMSEERRKAIAEAVLRQGMKLIEDDPYRYLLGDAPPPIATFTGGEGTYYLTSLSKCLWPSLRTSFLLAPSEYSSDKLRDALRGSSMGCSLLLTAVAEEWIRTGVAKQLVLDIQREVRARQTLVRNLLPRGVSSHPTGLHIWMKLPEHWNRQLFANALEQQGVLIACSDSFSIESSPANAVRLSLGGAQDQAALGEAVRKISTLLGEDRRRGGRAIV